MNWEEEGRVCQESPAGSKPSRRGWEGNMGFRAWRLSESPRWLRPLGKGRGSNGVREQVSGTMASICRKAKCEGSAGPPGG